MKKAVRCARLFGMDDHADGQASAPTPHPTIHFLRSLILEQQAAMDGLESSNRALASALEKVLRERVNPVRDEPLDSSLRTVDEDGFRALSKRELEVLALMVKGKSSKQIAAHLGISFKTAVTHRASIMSKMDVHETASVVREAIRRGLV